MITYAIRLRPGQDLYEELQRFAAIKGLQAAFLLTCVGSLTHAVLRLANQPGPTCYSGHFEIVSLVGTLSTDGPHLHISISDETGRTTGGHLLPGSRIYTTAEIVIGELEDMRFTRPLDPETGYDELVVEHR
jgi:uncharacterized protein